MSTVTQTNRNEREDVSLDSLEAYRISTLPPSMYYIPRFITKEEEHHILWSLPATRWTRLAHRRLQAHPSALSRSGTLLSAPLPSYLKTPILDRFEKLGIFADSPHKTANHCLVNEYEPGQGIMGHEDGGSYWPCTATVSLGDSIVLDVWDKSDGALSVPRGDDVHDEDKPTRSSGRWRILQEPRSLLVTTGEVYSSTLHGIAEIRVDEHLNEDSVANWQFLADRDAIEVNGGRIVRRTRTSLTYRDVVKVSDAGTKILGFSRRP